ncbi:hypothetical protein QBC33DRAFT_231857 [Phialemonium atrogriseum]|uniref:Uncharacterized protein n=1 Tax=Phialemonium atrogriseum TaxID=1093897 RepID=A0AAJ0FKI2_9PEZI|nr:uncharacterized protein QBC33DRAFT_231857 [Phialemonium atrogriseum]KAK1771102.1 hypothetical protein QBC33DRAFT_231857 [Phialemonium atrogriseum]
MIYLFMPPLPRSEILHLAHRSFHPASSNCQVVCQCLFSTSHSDILREFSLKFYQTPWPLNKALPKHPLRLDSPWRIWDRIQRGPTSIRDSRTNMVCSVSCAGEILGPQAASSPRISKNGPVVTLVMQQFRTPGEGRREYRMNWTMEWLRFHCHFPKPLLILMHAIYGLIRFASTSGMTSRSLSKFNKWLRYTSRPCRSSSTCTRRSLNTSTSISNPAYRTPGSLCRRSDLYLAMHGSQGRGYFRNYIMAAVVRWYNVARRRWIGIHLVRILRCPINETPIRGLLRRGGPDGMQAIQKWLSKEDLKHWREYPVLSRNAKSYRHQMRDMQAKRSPRENSLARARVRTTTPEDLEEVMSRATPEEKEGERARALEGIQLLEKMDAIGHPPKEDDGNNWWLLKVLQLRRGARCFLACDIVYAHLQLADFPDLNRDMIDYAASYNTAFHTVAECFMRRVTGLQILAFVEDIPLAERQYGVGVPDPAVKSKPIIGIGGRYERLASWAPNWTRCLPAEQNGFLNDLMRTEDSNRFLNREWKWRYCAMRNFFQLGDGVIGCIARLLQHRVLTSDYETTSNAAVLEEIDDISMVLSEARLSLPRAYMPGDIAVLIADAPDAVHFVRPQMDCWMVARSSKVEKSSKCAPRKEMLGALQSVTLVKVESYSVAVVAFPALDATPVSKEDFRYSR